MTTHLTKIWWDSTEYKLTEKVISESEIYKCDGVGTPLGANEVLRVTKDGQFIWHEDADRMIEEGDFSSSPAMPHILKALRKQRQWQGLTDEEIDKIYETKVWDARRSYARAIEAKLKEQNNG
jgi:hypothetical protein